MIKKNLKISKQSKKQKNIIQKNKIILKKILLNMFLK